MTDPSGPEPASPRRRGALVRVQRFGNFLSGMVMPNLGAFVAWGLLTALFIPTGWFPNESLAELVSPIMTYALPMLIGFTGGSMVHGARGGAIGVLATMGVVVGADVTMLIGAMVMGPVAAWLMKQVDRLFEGKVKPGFEMLISNFSMGILGLILAVAGYLGIGPVFGVVLTGLSAGVDWILELGLLPLVSILVAPAQVLFLNNAINHGIMGPLGIEQVAEQGRSILFLVDANPGPSVGTLLAISLFGVGMAKRTAPMAALIAGVGGIGEVYFPFVLMKPKLVFATMGGMATSLFLLQLLGGGTVATPSPGSFFAMMALSPAGAILGNLAGFFGGMAVSFVIGWALLRGERKRHDDDVELSDGSAEERDRHNLAAFEGGAGGRIRKVVVACDAGMGSSAMGASILKSKVRKRMLDVEVSNAKIEEIPADADLIVTHTQLVDRARQLHDDGTKRFMTITNFMHSEQYDDIVRLLERTPVTVGPASESAVPVATTSTAGAPAGGQRDGDVLVAANVILGASFASKSEAIDAAGAILVREGYVTDRYVASMHERDARTSVYLGNHVAIPHGEGGSESEIVRSGVSVVQVPDGVDFDGGTAYVVIGIAGLDGEHLPILSAIAERLLDDAAVERLRTATTTDEVLALLVD
ncbi:PTS mannitol transporter subunit IICBA [Agrococcus versicolor]